MTIKPEDCKRIGRRYSGIIEKDRMMSYACRDQGKIWVSGYWNDQATYVRGYCRNKNEPERYDSYKGKKYQVMTPDGPKNWDEL